MLFIKLNYYFGYNSEAPVFPNRSTPLRSTTLCAFKCSLLVSPDTCSLEALTKGVAYAIWRMLTEAHRGSTDVSDDTTEP